MIPTGYEARYEGNDAVKTTESVFQQPVKGLTLLLVLPSLCRYVPSQEEATDGHTAEARRHSYPLQEIAKYLTVHYATASSRAKRGRSQIEVDAKNKT
jgi:hypothetical protein